jgi:hypothetical protein
MLTRYSRSGNRDRIFIAISSAAHPHRRRRQTWQPINAPALLYIPNPTAEVGHRVTNRDEPVASGVVRQKHWDVSSDDAGESWHEISGNLPTDFGFNRRACARPVLFTSCRSRAIEHFPPDGKLRVYRSAPAATKRSPKDCRKNDWRQRCVTRWRSIRR